VVTTPEHARYAEWDAAYVLGALTAAARRAFEDHLADCEECRRAVVELLPTAGLLSRVSPERAEGIHGDPAALAGPDPAAREGLVARARRRRRRTLRWMLALAAAVVVVAAVAVPWSIAAMEAPPPSFALQDVADAPLEASVRLDPVAWGTRIDLTCRYTNASDGTCRPRGGPTRSRSSTREARPRPSPRGARSSAPRRG